VFDAAGIARHWSEQNPCFLQGAERFSLLIPKRRDSVAQQPFGCQAHWLRTGKYIPHDIRRQEGQIDQLVNPVF